MNIQCFPCEPIATNAYVISCVKTHEAIVIDPAQGSFVQIQKYLTANGLKLQKVLLTHSHWDHIADVYQFKNFFSVPVGVHALDVPNLEHPGTDKIPCWITIPGVKPDLLLEDEMQISIGELTFQVIHTPGHSPGCICFYEPQQGVLISGDTLFKGTMGTLALPTSDPALMWPSLIKLSHLPPQTRVYPGHGLSTTIGIESAWMQQAEKLFS